MGIPLTPVDVEGGSGGDSELEQRRPVISWKRNLVVMWLASFATAMGFTFVFPFVPLFVQEMGISDPAQAALWAGISSAAMGLGVFLFGPLWGMLGDRYGRKKNALRAIFGSAVLMALTGFSADVYQLTALRLLMGVVSGVFTTGLALVASTLPRERIAFGMGALQSALFLGSTVGPLVGGILADTVGFRGAFFVAGATNALAGVVVLVFARENFQRPAETGPIFKHQAFESLIHLLTSREIAPILAAIFVVQVSPLLMFAVLPVLLNTLTPGSGASATGIAFAILGVTAALTSYGIGWLSARVRLTRILAVSCVGAGLFYLPFMVVDSVPLLYLFLALGGVFQGVLISSTSGLLGLAIPDEKRGAGFGAMQSVMAGAFGIGPLTGGIIATVTGLRSVFLVQAIALFAAAVLVVRLLGGGGASMQRPSAEDLQGTPTGSAGR